ncbi:hotdog fold domain-containing protein [Arenicella xantha]|uniref:Acyl-coenzyme A thioesterase PaaI-like protein n=1 Tax=Arenicella xantha TaxID=644221 RepID=A0A395JFU0_9GAMM|nr:hotdog fold domain-containing protein [Arenicella xantha]RBP48281.1 acyl-coenzyme A thioesterase PaaI-like protein [Arenicella xantha]
MPSILQRYEQFRRLTGGNFVFSKVVGFSAPFFGKIRPNVIDLRPGYCEVQIKDRWGIRNHLGTINAGALCSLAEMTGGMALDTLVPSNMRWIPRSMTVNYLAKATGIITGVTDLPNSELREGDFVVPVRVNNSAGDTVFTADITFYVSLKK